MPRVISLFSGGLDSLLTACLLRDLGCQVEALNIKTPFCSTEEAAGRLAAKLGLEFRVHTVGEDYYELVKRPRYGFGKAVNPCIDCKIHFCQIAKRRMEETGAVCVATGEVLGQRPMSQQRAQLECIAKQSGLGDRLLRPLSAQWLRATAVEREGLIDREKLLALKGRGRRRQLDLAGKYGLGKLPSPSGGCALTETSFAPRVFDLIRALPDAGGWDFELLRCGRYFRIDHSTVAIVGKNAVHAEMLRGLFRSPQARNCAMIEPSDYRGPTVLVVGALTDENLGTGAGLVLRFGRPEESPSGQATVEVSRDGEMHEIMATITERAESLRMLTRDDLARLRPTPQVEPAENDRS